MIEFGLLAWLGCAIGAAAIASSKGRSGFGYLLLGLFLPFIGLLIAIGMTDARVDGASALDRPTKGNDLLLCWSCRRPYRADRPSCPDCGASRQRDPHADEKKCPACAEWVLKDARKCKHCGEAIGMPGALTASEAPRAPAAEMGYCPSCRKLRGMDQLRCVYCGTDSPTCASLPAA
jgi:hypothetical protein